MSDRVFALDVFGAQMAANAPLIMYSMHQQKNQCFLVGEDGFLRSRHSPQFAVSSNEGSVVLKPVAEAEKVELQYVDEREERGEESKDGKREKRLVYIFFPQSKRFVGRALESSQLRHDYILGGFEVAAVLEKEDAFCFELLPIAAPDVAAVVFSWSAAITPPGTVPRRKIVVFADCKWSIGRVHREIAKQLKSYEFLWHQDCSHITEHFLTDLENCDICLTTPNLEPHLRYLAKHNEKYQRKMLFVLHYMSEIENTPYRQLYTFGTITEAFSPSFPDVKLHLMPSGVNPALFPYRERSGRIETLGWVGNLAWTIKRVEWSYTIASKVSLPILLASSMPFSRMNWFYNQIDVLLVTSGPEIIREAGPLPPFEAIASGVLVIGTNVGNFSLLPGPKFATIAEAARIIEDLRLNPEKVRKIAREQYECVLHHWTWPSVAAKWAAVFDEMIRRNDEVRAGESANSKT